MASRNIKQDHWINSNVQHTIAGSCRGFASSGPDDNIGYEYTAERHPSAGFPKDSWTIEKSVSGEIAVVKGDTTGALKVEVPNSVASDQTESHSGLFLAQDNGPFITVGSKPEPPVSVEMPMESEPEVTTATINFKNQFQCHGRGRIQ